MMWILASFRRPMSTAFADVAGAALPTLLLATALFTTPFAVHGDAREPAGGVPAPCPDAAIRPFLVLHTAAGRLVVELHEEAAPEGVRRVVHLARGPLFAPELPLHATDATDASDATVGYYDGLGFDHTRPHVQIATGGRPPDPLFRVPLEIDAEALGLHRDRIGDAGQAMDVLQRELLPEHVRNKKGGSVSPLLQRWLDRWYEDYSADFLVGESRKRINEALGYEYRNDLASRPVVRGAVALWTRSPAWASPRLTIFLADRPQDTGRWMVIGSLVEGLEVAEAISARPRLTAFGKPSDRPVEPVVIHGSGIECRPAPAP